MTRKVSEGQWLAARQVSEGETPTRVRIGAMLGVDVSYVYARAAKEGWRVVDFRDQSIRALYREVRAIAAALSGRDLPDDGDDDDCGEDAGKDRPFPDAERPSHRPATAAGNAPCVREGPREPPSDPPASEPAPAHAAGPERPSLAVPAWDRMDPVELLSNAGAFVARQIGRLIENADRRGRLDKAQVDGLAALAKMMDRWETLATERAKENESRNDADLAATFEKINDKIVELAEAEARRLRAGERAGSAGAGGERGVVRQGEAGAVSAVEAEAERS